MKKLEKMAEEYALKKWSEENHKEFGGVVQMDTADFLDSLMEAFIAGRESLRKEQQTDKPEGWCAWHPEKDWMLATMCYDKHHAVSVLQDQLEGAYWDDFQDGWQIKPVRLVEVGDENN